MFNEFKKFISRGNVIDLAVGVIVGGAFGNIVTSLVNDMFMPLIGVILGGIDFKGLSIRVGSATIAYGNFIQNIINFLIISACIFLFIQFINKFITPKKEEKKPAEPSADVVLLTEIRDLLKENKKKAKKEN